MQTPLRAAALVLVAAGTAASGCDLVLFEAPRMSETPSTPFITTDLDVYEAEIGEMVVQSDTIWYVELTIPMTYTNRSGEVVWLTSCGQDYIHPPRLERRVDGAWETAYEPPHRACGGPSIRLEPGASHSYEFRIRGHDPHSAARVQPVWYPDQVAGEYRINWWKSLVLVTGQDRLPDPVPLEERISNTFRITGSLP